MSRLKNLKKLIAEELSSLAEEKFIFTEGPCGGICSHNGVVCCSTACDIGDCHCCCFENSPLCHSGTQDGPNKDAPAMKGIEFTPQGTTQSKAKLPKNDPSTTDPSQKR